MAAAVPEKRYIVLMKLDAVMRGGGSREWRRNSG